MEEGYFPSPATPIRNTHLSTPSPTKGLGSGGSVSSSLLASPPMRNDASLAQQQNGEAPDHSEETAESPAVQQLKRASGFASVRVGLGSPGLALNRDWSGKKRPGSDPPEEKGSALPSPMMPQIRTNDSFGLPTPPGTNSDIGVAPPMSRTVSGFSHTSDQVSPPRPPRHPRRTSSTHLPLLPDPDSPGPSSQSSSPRPRSSPTHRKVPSVMSRSSSSLSVPALDVLPEDSVHYSRAGSSTSGFHNSPRLVTGRSPSYHSVEQSAEEAREVLTSPSPTRNGAISPRKPHQRSPSLPVETAPRPTYRSNASYSSSVSREAAQPQANPHPQSPIGDALDDRIRQAEEQIRQSASLRPRTSGAADSTPPVNGQLRRHDSYNRNANSPSAYTSSTLRRSATLSSASVLTPNGDQDSGSSGRRYGPSRVSGLNDSTERERSGGSGSSGRRKPIPADFRNGGLFTPSPKPNLSLLETSHDRLNSAQRRHHRPSRSPDDVKQYTSPHRYTPNSRSEQTHTSPLDRVRAARQAEADGLPRAETSMGRRGEDGGYVRRQWHESISGLPQYSRPDSAMPQNGGAVRRAESVLGTAGDRYRYQSRGGSAGSAVGPERYRGFREAGIESSLSSRHALGPSDSVSVVGNTRGDKPESSRKDPLEVIKRIEQSRAEHQKQWEVERSASVMGDSSQTSGFPRPSSRLFDSTPRRHRPGTSMVSLRDVYDQSAPQTAPIDHWRNRQDQAIATADSPLVTRTGSRLRNQLPKPATEPRPLRSSTSLAMRAESSLDFSAPSSEHGRLLFEACRALELKLGLEVLDHLPDLLKAFRSSTRSTESVSTGVRSVLKLADDATVYLDLDDPAKAREELAKLVVALREASRASDQSVRELTRLMLDLPKLLRQAERAGPSLLTNRPSMELDRRPSPVDHLAGRVSNRYDGSPGRASHDVLRPSTSMAEVTSPLHRYSLDSRRPMLQPRSQPRDRDRNSAMSNLVAKMRGLNSRTSPLPKHSDLQPIEQSPPNQVVERLPSSSGSKSKSRSSLALSSSPTKSTRSSSPTKSSQSCAAPPPPPPPRSPERRNVLRKKASAASTHTVRGSSSFLPASSQVRTTTAVSTVNAGDLEPELTPAKSIRSTRTMSTRASEVDVYPGSPSSRYSFALDAGESDIDSQARGSIESAGLRDGAISVLEHSLAAAAKKRDDEERRPSMGERFRASLRRGPSQRVKE